MDINKTIDNEISRMQRIIISFGGDFTVELTPRLIQVNGETEWIAEPRIRGKKAKRLTATQFIKMKMLELSYKISPVGRDLVKNHERGFVLWTASNVIEEEAARRWVKEFSKKKSEAYLYDKGFLRHDVSDRLKSLCVDEGYKNINNIISTGILNNENPQLMRSRIREDVFGLTKGERNKGLTARSEMIMRTELSYAERNVNREVMRQDKEKVGVRLHYYGGPCNSNVCPSIINSGFNVKGGTADFYFDTGIPWPPYHPNCHCAVLRYLYAEDMEERDGGGKIPHSDKIFIEDKKIVYGRAA